MKKMIKAAAFMGGAAEVSAAVYLFFYAFYRKRIRLFGKEEGGERSGDWKTFTEKSKEGEAWMRTKHMESITILSEEGLRLTGTMLWAERDTGKTVIAVHGYRGQAIRDFAGSARFYHDMGYNLLMVDNRAHGDSEGAWIGFGWKDKNDIRRWCEYLVDRTNGAARIVLLGVSMGGAAVMMASGDDLPYQVKGIIEDCGYSTVWDQLWSAYPKGCRFPKRCTMYLASGISKLVNGFSFKEASCVRQLQKNRRPMLFIHGGADAFVPTRMVYEAYAATKGEKRLLIVEGAGHALSVVRDPERYYGSIRKFLTDFVQKGE